MKRLAVLIDLYPDGRSQQAVEAEQIKALREMAHTLSTANLSRRGGFTTADGTRIRWTFKETETRQ